MISDILVSLGERVSADLWAVTPTPTGVAFSLGHCEGEIVEIGKEKYSVSFGGKVAKLTYRHRLHDYVAALVQDHESVHRTVLEIFAEAQRMGKLEPSVFTFSTPVDRTARYHAHRDAGKCVADDCGSPATVGKLCALHSRRKNSGQRERRKNLVELKACADCKGKLDTRTKLCSHCKKKYQDRQKKKYAHKRAHGECYYCDSPASQGMTTCARCTQIRHEIVNRAAAKRRAAEKTTLKNLMTITKN